MALGRIKRIVQKSLSIAMAAAMIVTSIPQFSTLAAAQELGDVSQEFEERTLEDSERESESGTPESQEPEEETGKEINSEQPTEDASKEHDAEQSDTAESNATVEDKRDKETENSSPERTSEESSENDNTQERKDDEEETKEESSDAEETVKDEKEDKTVDNKEENRESIEENKGGKALRFQMTAVNDGKWKDLVQKDINAPENLTFDSNLQSDYQISYDLYLPKEAAFAGDYYVKVVTKLGADWTWTDGAGSNVSRDDFTSCAENDALVRYTFTGILGESVKEYNILKAIVIAIGSSNCTYDGVMFVDNIKLMDENGTILMLEDFSNYEGAVDLGSMEGITEGDGDQEEQDGTIIYKENFNSWTDLDAMESPAENEAKAALVEIAEDNKAIEYSIDLSKTSEWTDIFKASLKLSEAYNEAITDKVNMTFDVYVPADSIQTDFGTMKAQAALKVGNSWTWITQKSWPQFTADDLAEDDEVPGYKKYTFSIDMNDFQTWDNDQQKDIPWDFADITPIQTVIPCLAGDISEYSGKIYLDNVCVTAYNKEETEKPAEGDVVLELDKSAWEVIEGYQYSATSTIENKTVDSETLLAAAVDYSANADKGWSEAKFDYTHPQPETFEGSYNAFTADVYYKPAAKIKGGLAVKISSDCLRNENGVDAELPEGEAVMNIPELEGYYKAQLELIIETKKNASFSNLTLGMVGKNTDYKGDIYFGNMKFTNIEVKDIYVDSTVEVKKGDGITVAQDGRSITTASGETVPIASEVSLVDADANEATQKLYAYLKAVGESDSVIFGHQNDTHHKAGSKEDGFSNSDTKDVTGSIAGIIGIDVLSLTGDEASTWDTPEAQRIQKVADITREAAAEGALITLSAHMPNFDVIDKRVKAYEEAGKKGNKSDTLGYWEVDGQKQYNFSGYTPGTLDGNVVARIMPGQDLNYLFRDYLDLIADYAKAVEDDGITILFRPFHENTGGWFWWGKSSCDEEAYINLFRYTVDYMKEQGIHNILYVYGPGSEAVNVTEYAQRYPGDAYVDMIGYDLYHADPTKANEAKYLEDIGKQNAILKEFAQQHNKLYAITETGVANGSTALLPSGNEVMDWYMRLLNEISDDGVCYFLTWANFSDTTFYLPFVTKKNDDGFLHGHETLDDFIHFYNDNRSVFATDMSGGHQQIQGVSNTNKGDAVSGYFIAPLSGDRILPNHQENGTRIAAKLTGVENNASNVKFVLKSDFGEETLTASYEKETALWEAVLEDTVLDKLGESMGKITLLVDSKEIAAISAIFNLAEAEQDDMLPDDFESYGGSADLLNREWATNKDTGSQIAFLLTKDEDKVFGGNYALQIDITLAAGSAWAGATKNFAADWSKGNALEFYTIPEKNGQKVVVQVTSGGVIYEAYLQEFEAYTKNAENGVPVKVTIPFQSLKDRDNKGVEFNPAKIESIGLWCNAIEKEGIEFPLETTLYYDEIKVVTTDKTEVWIEDAEMQDPDNPDNPDDPDNPDNPENPEDPEEPSVSAGFIYNNNFDAETDIANIIEGGASSGASLVELVSGNKAIRFTTDLTNKKEWTDIFQAQLNLSEPYTKEITNKAVMSFDVYFPIESIGESFGTMKAQAVLKTGDDWKWTAQQSWPSYTFDNLEEDVDVPGYKKLHVEIDMNNFKIGEETGTIADIIPIRAVIPCLAGDVSSYKGDIYLDNVRVEAFSKADDVPELPPINENGMFLSTEASAWSVTDGYEYSGASKVSNETAQNKKMLVTSLDYSNDANKGWSEAKFHYTHPQTVSPVSGYNAFEADVYYKPADKTQGDFAIKLFCQSLGIDKDAILPEGTPVENIAGLEGYYKSEYQLEFDTVNNASFSDLTMGIVGKNTNFKGDIYFDNMRFTKAETIDIYKDTTIKPQKGSGITVTDNGRSITTASGKTVSIASEIALVDANANEATQKLYAYLKAIGESDSVIFGHQNDTHHKAGNSGEGFTNSDTKDITGSIAGVVGIDALSLTGNEALMWDAPEAQRIQYAADLTRAAAAEGALITLSAHMPNFDVIDQKVKAFEASNKSGNTNDTLGYWEVDGEKQYNFSGYTPGTLTGNVVTRVMPGQDLNYLFTDYLDLIADYAKAVEKDGITILFRPFHENTGSWFWWGAALCDKEAYINLYRYTVDYLKEQGVHNLLYVYGPGSEAANAVEYAQRYPGDAYVDMIGYDLYHSNPTKENQAGYLENISRQNAILREFAQKHNKLYAITETGVANGSTALLPSGNEVLDWYMQLLEEISDDGVCYFLTWANFNDTTSFYTPFVKERKEDGILYGHEMLDEFIKFYNDGRSVFATDMSNGFGQISGVVNTTKEDVVSGYMITPLSGDRLLPGQTEAGTRIAAKVTGVDKNFEGIRFVLTSDFDEEICKASYNEETKMWEAVLPDYALINLGEGLGTIVLQVNGQEVASISVGFNMVEAGQDDMIPDDFEGYGGSSQQLNSAWATNKASGSEIVFILTDDTEKVFGGNYGLQMDITLASGDAWAGADKSFTADWSNGNALEFYTIPEKFGQKVVVQVKSGGEIFEVYLQEYPAYTKNAASGIPVKVTVPFAAFAGRDNKEAVFDPAKIESIGLWCNAIPQAGITFPLNTTLYYDEIKVVKLENPEQKDVIIESTAKEGIWIRAIAPQEYTGKAVKPVVAVYDGAKLLTLKTDYTVSYKDNKKVGGDAKVIVKGKGNYSETIEQKFVIEPKKLDSLTITYPEYLAYNGREQAVAVTVKDGKKKLSSKNDYDLKITFVGNEETSADAPEVLKAKEEGIYKIEITGKGNYAGTVTVNCEMVNGKNLLSRAVIKLPSSSVTYETDKAAVFEESAIVVKLGGKSVPQKEADGTINYTVSYENNTAPGTAAVIITAGEGSGYVGSCRKNFTVKGAAFSTKAVTITEFQSSMPYTGKPVFQNPVLKDKASGTELRKGIDYRVTYKNHVNAGKAVMQFTGIGKYSGTITKTYTISKAVLTEDMLISSTKIEAVQNRAGVQPDVVILYKDRTLVNGQDYTLTYSNNKNITTDNKKAYITIKGKGSFTGTLRNAVEIVIRPKSLQSSDIIVEVPDMKYTRNKAQYNPNPIVYDNGKKLVKNKDYIVSYESNTREDIGEITESGHIAKVIITAKGADYITAAGAEDKDSDTRTVTFRIIEKLIKDAKVTVKNTQYFSQQGVEPSKEDIDITYNGTTVNEEEYEIISYSQNTKKGNAVMVIQGKGQYGGTKTVKFKINARGMGQNWADKISETLSSLSEMFS